MQVGRELSEIILFASDWLSWLGVLVWDNLYAVFAVILGLVITSVTLHGSAMSQNFVAGVVIRWNRFFRKGHYVTLTDGSSGLIQRIGFSHTKILDLKNRDTIFVAHGDAIAGSITNHSRPYGHPITVTIPIFDFGSGSRSGAIGVIRGSAEMFTGRLPSPDFQPSAWMDSVGGNCEYYKSRIFVDESEIPRQGGISGILLKQTCDDLERNGYGVGEVGMIGLQYPIPPAS